MRREKRVEPKVKLLSARKLLATSLALLSCLVLQHCSRVNPSKNTKLLVYVAGDGVPPIRQNLDRLFPLNRAQGQAMWKGAKTALDHSPRLASIRHLVEIKGHDDGGLAEEARSFARSLQRKEEVIAVIGHATSETTQAAAGAYDDAGIPLLMPIATSDLVMYRDIKRPSSERVHTAFRLPPSDGRAQAPAVAFLVKELGLQKVTLVQDVSEGARGYSDPLLAVVSPLLKRVTIAGYAINRAHKDDFTEAVNVVRAHGSDSIVFVGYGSTAQELIHALRAQYSAVDIQNRPKLILTDGCLIPDLNLDGFESYLTFPHVELKQPGTTDEEKDIELVHGLFGRDLTLSYEPFGYDAMLIIGQAFQKCLAKGRVSRTCITRALTSSGPFFGTTGVFEFDLGENRHSSYDVFRADPESNFKLDPSRKIVITSDTLARFRSNF